MHVFSLFALEISSIIYKYFSLHVHFFTTEHEPVLYPLISPTIPLALLSKFHASSYHAYQNQVSFRQVLPSRKYKIRKTNCYTRNILRAPEWLSTHIIKHNIMRLISIQVNLFIFIHICLWLLCTEPYEHLDLKRSVITISVYIHLHMIRVI